MLPVKPNNQTRNTRANSRKNTKTKDQSANQFIYPKSNKSKNKSKDFNCANQVSDTAEQGDPTINTGLVNRKHNQPGDTKTTIRKVSFQNKPIIKEVNKKLNNFSKQYTPQYFTTILEYMIQKQIKNTASPTVERINKWRVYIERQRRIQLQVRKQVRKMANMIITGRKKFKESIKQQERNKFNESQNASSNYEHYSSLNYPNLKSERYNNHQYQSDTSSSQVSSSIQNASCPDVINFQHNSQPIMLQNLTESILNKQWDSRFDQFACLIQTIYQLLGENQCCNTIFPACYIFYTLLVVDTKVFNFMNHTMKKVASEQQSQYSNNNNRYLQSSSYKEPTLMEMIEYYVIVSILIATKYHQIYPASLIDLIESVNESLSFDRAVKIEGQILEMFDFTEFFNENQLKFLRMFGIVIGWATNQMNVCEFMLQSGLNNPKLYSYSPLYKAAVVIGLYQQQFLKTQQKFMMIKNLCPGLTLELATKIKKQYSQIIIYNYKNKLHAQKKKFYIFENQMKNLMSRSNVN